MSKTNAAKGIAVLMLMIVEIAAIPLLLRAFIYSVAFPLFFVVCGLEKRNRRNEGLSLAVYLLICVFAIVYCAEIKAGLDWREVFAGITPLWLVPACCLLRLLNAGFDVCEQKSLSFVNCIMAAAIAAFGFALGYKGIYLPLGADILCVAVFFLYFGRVLFKKKAFFAKMRYFLVPAAILCWCVLVYSGRWMEMPIRAYRGHVLSFVASCAGCVVVLWLGKIAKKCRGVHAFLNWCGEKSVILLCVTGFAQLYIDWMDIYAFVPTTWEEDALFRIFVISFFAYCLDVTGEKLVRLNRI